MFPRVIPQDLKNKIYEVTQEAFECDGRVEIEKVRALLEENFGICFFNTIELEKLIKQGLDKQIFAYKGKGIIQEKPLAKSIDVTEPKKQGMVINYKTSISSKEDVEKAIEELRERMNTSIELNSKESSITLQLSQKLDILIVASMRNSL